MSRVSFGGFVLDLDSRELLRGRNAVSLAPKAYQLLRIILARSRRARWIHGGYSRETKALLADNRRRWRELLTLLRA